MTLQQLRYIIAIAEEGSISKASKKIIVSQPSISKAVFDLENELNIKIFNRTNRGVSLTEEGEEFLSYSRSVIEQADFLESKYKNEGGTKRVFSISSQHYAFVVNAFVLLVKEFGKREYDFSLRETTTYQIIEDVKKLRSQIGIMYLSNFNRNILLRILEKEGLIFNTIFKAKPHVFISRNHPLAKKDEISLEDLSDYPRLSYEQDVNNSFYFSEELFPTESSPKNIYVTDRASIFNLIIGLDGYTISSGVLSEDLNGSEIIVRALKADEDMDIGYITLKNRPLDPVSKRYIEFLKGYIDNFKPSNLL